MESANFRDGNSGMSSLFIAKILLLLMTYWALVLYIGPAFMKNRRPYKLRTTLLVYNAVQVVISVYLTIISLREIITFGFLPRKCYMAIEEHRELVALGNYLYFIAKVSELLDTLFFVLRKKDNQVSFLHVYHHSAMVFAWVVFRNHPSHISSFLRSINSAIHMIMYAYYGLAALGPNVAKYLKWKKYITTMQLVQFVAVIIYAIATDYISECPPSTAHGIFLTGNLTFVLILFVDFYMKNYTKKEKTRVDTDTGCISQTVDKKDD